MYNIFSSGMDFIMDVQGFKGVHNQFIVKELAIMSTDGQMYEFQLFQPPCHFNQLSEDVQKQVHFLEKQFHGLFWSSGFQPYSNLKDILRNMKLTGVVYVKGVEKSLFVSELLHGFKVSVINIEDIGCPSLSVLKKHLQPYTLKPCAFSHDSKNCAYINVNAILQWFRLEQFTKDRMKMVNIAMSECKKRGYSNLQLELVKFLPKEFIISYHEDIELIYDKLQKDLQSDPEILCNLRCDEHIHSKSGGNCDELEGANPKRKHCRYCISTNCSSVSG